MNKKRKEKLTCSSSTRRACDVFAFLHTFQFSSFPRAYQLPDELCFSFVTVLHLYIMFKSQNYHTINQWSYIVRNNTQNLADLRWEVLKSMLDEFPQLRDRVEQYLRAKREPTQISPTDRAGPRVKELFQKAASDYFQEHLRK